MFNRYKWKKKPFVTVIAGQNIQSVSGSGKYKPNDSVTVEAVVMPQDRAFNYTFKAWTGDLTSSDAKFTFLMPRKRITLTAEATASQRYHFARQSAGGMGGGSFTVTASIPEGAIFDGWTTCGVHGNPWLYDGPHIRPNGTQATLIAKGNNKEWISVWGEYKYHFTTKE